MGAFERTPTALELVLAFYSHGVSFLLGAALSCSLYPLAYFGLLLLPIFKYLPLQSSRSG
ncbi:hypothetical protein DQG13_18455 [Paenibacillus sp. YN15]|nr:hypothetical protein DQG13_18455 [Paenibacillus sp. YN15]